MSLDKFNEYCWEDAGLFDQVKGEAARAVHKHGFDQTPASPKMFQEAALVILAEEFGEVARAMTYDEGNREDLVKELIQLATMALMMAYGVDHRA